MEQHASKPLIEEKEEEEILEQAQELSPRLTFEAIRRTGEEELRRPMSALWFSGIAAGLLIAFSVWAEAVLRAYLPDASWGYLIENAGYTLGFMLVILSRLQLFTENTITTVVPAVITPTPQIVARTARLWGVVLSANVVGAFAIAAFLAAFPVMSEEVRAAFTDLSKHATGMPAWEGFIRGIPAGVLIAALVWMMPGIHSGHIALIFMVTWFIALGDFTHIVAGSVEMAFLLLQGELAVAQAVFGFFFPVFFGNVVGGTAIFTMLTWAQIRPEVVE